MEKPKPKRKARPMDALRWKSIIVPREMYDEMVIIKDVEGRTLSGQLRLIFKSWKDQNLSIKDQLFVSEKVAEMRAASKDGLPVGKTDNEVVIRS